jgi:protein-S-isoprenylcysteine O-methyltransferase Ste14
MEYVFLVLAWALYFGFHSFFASDNVKKRISISPRLYRLAYSILSTLGLFAILFYSAWIGGEPLFSRTELLTYVALFISAGGIIIINAAFRNYSIREFLGLSRETGSPKLVTNGINAWVRHPLYTGTILITLGYFLFDPRLASLISVACIWLYLWIGIYLEEKKLIKLHGKKYIRYKADVAAVIPFLL